MELTSDPTLPQDPDTDVDETTTGGPLPVRLRPVFIAIVFVGGTFGVAAREGLSLAMPARDGVPYAIFVANIVGAFVLGMLLEALVRRGPDHGRRRALRLLLGTGAMGGFTTYSALATDAARLIGDGRTGVAVAYALATVLVGAAATLAGIALGVLTHAPSRRARR